VPLRRNGKSWKAKNWKAKNWKAMVWACSALTGFARPWNGFGFGSATPLTRH
jgi:hypothetical protein